MSRDRDEKILLVADEAHLLADPNTPQSLMFLRNVAKRARKYMAGLIVVSQSIQDFLNDAVKIYTQAVVDLSTYKIFMGCNGLELQAVTDTYRLREAEHDRLESEIRGQGVMFAGNKRLFIEVHASEWKFEYMGSGGGK